MVMRQHHPLHLLHQTTKLNKLNAVEAKKPDTKRRAFFCSDHSFLTVCYFCLKKVLQYLLHTIIARDNLNLFNEL
jgi:hypothetical protein